MYYVQVQGATEAHGWCTQITKLKIFCKHQHYHNLKQVAAFSVITDLLIAAHAFSLLSAPNTRLIYCPLTAGELAWR